MSPSWCVFWNPSSFAFSTQVIAAAGSDEKCKLATRKGAQWSVNYSQGSLKEAVRKLVGDGGVDVVIDSVGGDIFLEALRRLVTGLFLEWVDLLETSQTCAFLPALLLFRLCCSLLQALARTGTAEWGRGKNWKQRGNQEMLKYSNNKISNGKISKTRLQTL